METRLADQSDRTRDEGSGPRVQYIGSMKTGIKEGLPRPLVTGSSASNSYHNLPVPFGYYTVTLLFYPSDNTPVLVTVRHSNVIISSEQERQGWKIAMKSLWSSLFA